MNIEDVFPKTSEVEKVIAGHVFYWHRASREAICRDPNCSMEEPVNARDIEDMLREQAKHIAAVLEERNLLK